MLVSLEHLKFPLYECEIVLDVPCPHAWGTIGEGHCRRCGALIAWSPVYFNAEQSAVFSAVAEQNAKAEARLYDETTASPSFDLRPGLSTLQAPTLLLHGSADFVPLQVVRPIQEAITGARSAVLDRCGHFPLMEQPTRAVSCLGEFLTDR